MSANYMISPNTIQIRLVDTDVDKHIDIKNLNEEEVKSLRTIDPFTYFSIPGIRRAHMHHQEADIDHSNTEALCRSPEVQSRDDNPSSSNKRPRSSTTIKRRTSISYEAHPSTILEDLMDELEDLSEDAFSKALD